MSLGTVAAARVRALQDAVNDRWPVSGEVPDVVLLPELQAILPNTPVLRALDVFDEMCSFRDDLARCDESEPAYRHARDRFDALAEAAVAADMEAGL